MNFLEERIMKDGIVKAGNVLKVDSFLNHQMDVTLMEEIGREFYRRFADKKITKVLTIETSGIAVAYPVAREFGVPLVFAKKAKSVNDLVSEKEKIEADHKAAMDKLNAEHASKMAELEATYKKQAKASAAGADPNVMRIQLALEDFKRTVTVVSSTIGKMKAEGGEAAQKADKMKAQVETFVGTLIAEAGWTV